MRDLEIRGAGNVLGTSQHGHMEAVGYEMYLQLLSEAVSETAGESRDTVPQRECLVDIQHRTPISRKDYIDNLSQRIDIYKKIASIRNEEDSYGCDRRADRPVWGAAAGSAGTH